MKNKKGFTLIELLAIIVILAVIAVITVPIILNIIDNSKKGAITDSAYGYKDALQKYNMTMIARNSESQGLKGSYTVSELKNLELEVSGREPNDGVVLLDEEGISGCLNFDGYVTFLYNNQVINTSKGNCPKEKIVTSGDGLYKSVTEPGRLIYRGANPNNKIFLKEDGTNNTLYRIVSYEVDGTIKVVRNDNLFDKEWDESTRYNSNNEYYCTVNKGCNVWGNQSNTLYNGSSLGDNFHYSYYTNTMDTTLTNGDSGKVGKEASLNKYLNDGSWNVLSNLDKYIENHKFNVGGIYYYNGQLDGNKGFVKEKQEESLYTWTGKIGLLNITEYIESSLNPSCKDLWSNYYYNPDNESLRASNEWPCKFENYNYKSEYHQWSLSPASYYKEAVWQMHIIGAFDHSSAYTAIIGVRPAFYLKSSISLSGTGVSGDEYQIK